MSVLLSLLLFFFGGSVAEAPDALPTLPSADDPALLYRSTDRGETWVPFTTGLPAGVIPVEAYQRQCNYVLRTMESGIFFCALGPEAGMHWEARSNGLPERPMVTSIIGDGQFYILSTYDKGVFVTNDLGRNWRRPAINLNTPVVSLAWVNKTIVATTDKGLFQSYDRGESWLSLGKIYRVNLLMEHNGILFAARQNTIGVITGDKAEWSTLQTDWAIGSLWAEGDFVYARTAKGAMMRSKNGLDWERPMLIIPGTTPESFPEALWRGLEVRLPGDQAPGYLHGTDVGWLATVKGGC